MYNGDGRFSCVQYGWVILKDVHPKITKDSILFTGSFPPSRLHDSCGLDLCNVRPITE